MLFSAKFRAIFSVQCVTSITEYSGTNNVDDEDVIPSSNQQDILEIAAKNACTDSDYFHLTEATEGHAFNTLLKFFILQKLRIESNISDLTTAFYDLRF